MWYSSITCLSVLPSKIISLALLTNHQFGSPRVRRLLLYHRITFGVHVELLFRYNLFQIHSSTG